MTQEAKFTPGPWEADPLTGRGAWIKGPKGKRAALTCGETNEEAAANACLIAAAPETLAELKRLTDNAANGLGITLHDIDKARTLIAKATTPAA